MINPNELRIGNIVDCEQLGGWAIIASIGETSFRVKDFDFGLLYERNNPIPLTEEILLKVGYKKENTLNDGTIVFSGCPYIYFKEGEIRYSYRTIKIDALHKWQNAHYILTNEELPIAL